MMFRLTNPFTPALLAATFLGAVVLAGPVAASAAEVQAATSTTGMTSIDPNDGVEKRIKDLHHKLHITTAQEPQWGVVAQAMRDNAKTMDGLIKSRAAHAKTMTAMDDLRSYEQLAAAHEDALKTFTPLFQTLYDGLSDAQRKSADAAFRSHESHHRKI